MPVSDDRQLEACKRSPSPARLRPRCRATTRGDRGAARRGRPRRQLLFREPQADRPGVTTRDLPATAQWRVRCARTLSIGSTPRSKRNDASVCHAERARTPGRPPSARSIAASKRSSASRAVTAGREAAHDARQRGRTSLVGDHEQRPASARLRVHRAARALAGAVRAAPMIAPCSLSKVEGVQRLPELEHDVVRDRRRPAAADAGLRAAAARASRAASPRRAERYARSGPHRPDMQWALRA